MINPRWLIGIQTFFTNSVASRKTTCMKHSMLISGTYNWTISQSNSFHHTNIRISLPTPCCCFPAHAHAHPVRPLLFNSLCTCDVCAALCLRACGRQERIYADSGETNTPSGAEDNSTKQQQQQQKTHTLYSSSMHRDRGAAADCSGGGRAFVRILNVSTTTNTVGRTDVREVRANVHTQTHTYVCVFVSDCVDVSQTMGARTRAGCPAAISGCVRACAGVYVRIRRIRTATGVPCHITHAPPDQVCCVPCCGECRTSEPHMRCVNEHT